MCGILGAVISRAQYAPAAGIPGSSAIYKDSSIVAFWADSIFFNRGYIAINDSSLGLASVGDANSAKGKALENGVLSLGDGGTATAFFQQGILNLSGPEFAIFENGFELTGSNKYHIELAYVEVSTDGIKYYRFPNHSATQDSIQTGNFDGMFPEQIDGLAGKYIAGFGTPFDLELLKDSIGNKPVYYIRVRDVVGALNDSFCSFDSDGRKINDPWPSSFASSGFDLDAIALLNEIETVLPESNNTGLNVYPNPINNESMLSIELAQESPFDIYVYNAIGQCLIKSTNNIRKTSIPIAFNGNFLIVQCKQNNRTFTTKVIRQ